jgi:thiamine-monophosphate kinase
VTVSELGERALLARIQAKLNATGRPPASLVVGIGDDAAVVASTRNAHTVITTDAQIEGVHFERKFSTPTNIGYRALTVNLSDLAAMGAVPRWALLSLAMRDDFPVADVEELVAGIAEGAAKYNTFVIGGNLTRITGPLIVDMTVMGEVKPRRALTRSGGRPGDALYVSGTVGGAAAGLEMLRAAPEGQGVSLGVPRTDGEHCIARYLRPEPRVRLGIAIAHARAARAAMDSSDGLADAAHQIADASGCGVEIDAAALPIEPAARAWWDAAGKDAVLQAMSGGDDYELVFAVPRGWSGRLRHVQSRVAEPSVTRIGTLTKDRGSRVLLRDGRRVAIPRGFEHF